MNFSDIFKTFNQKNILVIGDIMLDDYLWGDVNRISPEAPVPILGCKHRESRLGGAANVALNLKSLGANPILASVVGDDGNGNNLRSILVSKRSISDKYIISDPERPTTVKTRILSNGQQLLRIDDETTHPLSQDIASLLLKTINCAFDDQEIHAVIFEDYDKGVLNARIIEEITHIANMRGIPSFADPKKENFFDYKNITLFKPNFKEFCAGINTQISSGDIQTITQHSKQFLNESKNKYLLITLSEHGILLAGDSTHHFPAVKRDISDVSGAGDTVISVISLCYISGIPIDQSAKIANIAGGLVCEKSGVVPISKEELLKELERIN